MNLMLAYNLTKFNIIEKFTIIVNPGQLIRKSFLGLVGEGLYLKQSNRNTPRIQEIVIPKVDLIHVVSRNV